MSTRVDQFLTCNRLVKEEWEDKEYQVHLKKVLRGFFAVQIFFLKKAFTVKLNF